MNPTVSIVVTCYNYGEYVAGCLRSIQQQNFTDFEVIVVDDGSTDNSAEKIKPFLEDNRFIYIKQNNCGQAKAKNVGINKSRGSYIAFLDADDLWEKYKLSKQIKLFSSIDIGVVFSKARYIDAEGKNIDYKLSSEYLKPRRGRVTDYLLMDNFVPFSSSIIRRQCLNRYGLFDESLSMGIDWDLWLRISNSYQFEYCDEPLLFYRIGHSGQMSKNILERIKCADKIYNKFLRNFSANVSKKKIHDALYYSYCSRGYILRIYSNKYIFKYYLKAIKLYPLKRYAYIKLIKTLIKNIYKL